MQATTSKHDGFKVGGSLTGFRHYDEYAYSGFAYSGPYNQKRGSEYGGVFDGFHYSVERVNFYGFSGVDSCGRSTPAPIFWTKRRIAELITSAAAIGMAAGFVLFLILVWYFLVRRKKLTIWQAWGYYCGKDGHTTRTCDDNPYWNSRCSTCHMLGHINTECRSSDATIARGLARKERDDATGDLAPDQY